MFRKVSVKEIKDIKNRLETELKDKDLTPFRRKGVECLRNYIDTWFEWLDLENPKHLQPTGSITPFKNYFKPIDQ